MEFPKTTTIIASLATIPCLIQPNSFSYENQQACLSALEGPKADPKLIEMICETATYTVIKNNAEESWELEKKGLQEEALQQYNKGKTKSKWKRIRSIQEQKNKAISDEKAAEEMFESERKHQSEQRLKCKHLEIVLEVEMKRGVPQQIAEHNLRTSQPAFATCKN